MMAELYSSLYYCYLFVGHSKGNLKIWLAIKVFNILRRVESIKCNMYCLSLPLVYHILYKVIHYPAISQRRFALLTHSGLCSFLCNMEIRAIQMACNNFTDVASKLDAYWYSYWYSSICIQFGSYICKSYYRPSEFRK